MSRHQVAVRRGSESGRGQPHFMTLREDLQRLGTLLCLLFLANVAKGDLKILQNQSRQAVFSGDARPINVMFQNRESKIAEVDLGIRLHQTSSATTVLLNETAWKRLQVLPGQTVLESARVTFPDVKGETPFLVQWVEGTNKVIGSTEVLVYPTNILKELKPLSGEESLGVFDPLNVLKPLLKVAGVEISDLEDTNMEDFHGKLAILGPLQSRTQMREGFAERVRTMAAKDVAVVWLQPPPGKRDPMKPNFYTLQQGRGAVVIVQASEITDLAESPQAQVNLIRFCRLALHPEPLRLPFMTVDQ